VRTLKSAHPRQLDLSLQLLPKVGCRLLSFEDGLLILQELLPASVQEQMTVPQVLDFPLSQSEYKRSVSITLNPKELTLGREEGQGQ
jgi:hypothetical protein